MDIYYNKVVQGNIVDFDFGRIHKSYRVCEIKGFLDQIDKITREEYDLFTKTYQLLKPTYYDIELMFKDLYRIFDSVGFRNAFHSYVLEKKLSLVDGYKMAYQTFYIAKNNPLMVEFKQEHFDYVEELKKFRARVLLRIEMLMISEKLKDIEYDCILQFKKFKKEYYHCLTPFVKGLIFNSCGAPELCKSFAYEFELPTMLTKRRFKGGSLVLIDGEKQDVRSGKKHVVTYKRVQKVNTDHMPELGEKPIYGKSKINVYAPLADLRDLDKVAYGDWYTGVAPFKSEFMFVTKGALPTLAEQQAVYTELLTKASNKEVYIALPDFRKERPTEYLGEITIDLEDYKKFDTVFIENITAIANASHETRKQVNVVVPMIRVSTELEAWKRIISTCFIGCRAPQPKIGFMIETESAFDYVEDYVDMDFAIIDLDDLVEEMCETMNRYTKISYKDFHRLFLFKVKDAHKHFQSYGSELKHIISGQMIKNKTIFNKLLKMGYRDFSIPLGEIKGLQTTLKDYIDRRGRFIGVAARRKQRALYKSVDTNKDDSGNSEN